jgi:hypothetical protein
VVVYFLIYWIDGCGMADDKYLATGANNIDIYGLIK